jgi:serine phosphatase RsbU (regulator of sigma subunit)
MAGMPYREYEIQMEPGSKLFVYTDGLPEAMGGADGREMFGTERMLETLNGAGDSTPEELLEHVRTELMTFVGEAEQFDDLTMLCVEYRGA